jgi:hypothetical protein
MTRALRAITDLAGATVAVGAVMWLVATWWIPEPTWNSTTP